MRGRVEGVASVVRFNWPMYLAAAVLAIALIFVPHPIAWLALAGAGWFLVGSLGASLWVYDLSDLYRWRWLERALGEKPIRRAVVAHTGFDEVSVALSERLPAVEWTVLDHFTEGVTTEASIRRARAHRPPVAGTLPAPPDSWPLPDHAIDAVFALLSIHELRTVDERAAWFREAARCTVGHARIIVVEHVRDLANFLAFGPGFAHFHSVAAWEESWRRGGWRRVDSFRITPFVLVFVLEKL